MHCLTYAETFLGRIEPSPAKAAFVADERRQPAFVADRHAAAAVVPQFAAAVA